jgi:hypothetical protein
VVQKGKVVAAVTKAPVAAVTATTPTTVAAVAAVTTVPVATTTATTLPTHTSPATAAVDGINNGLPDFDHARHLKTKSADSEQLTFRYYQV